MSRDRYQELARERLPLFLRAHAGEASDDERARLAELETAMDRLSWEMAGNDPSEWGES